jgi:glycogen(starch) synthase
MRVLLVSEFFLPTPYGGGVGRHVYDLAKYLLEQGDEVHILTSKLSSPRIEDPLPESIKVLRKLKPLSREFFLNKVKGFYGSFDLTAELNRIGNEYDIVHIHSMRTHFLYLHRLSKPVIATLHGTFPICIRQSPLYNLCKSANGARCAICYVNQYPTQALIAPAVAINCHYHYKLTRISLTSIRKIICVSEYVKQQIRDCFGLPEERMITIPNGVSPEGFKSLGQFDMERFRRDLTNSSDKIILFVGRLIWEKGVHVLIASMPSILKKVNAKLVIVGDGPYKEFLRESVQRHGLNDKVVFAGSVDDKTLKLIYQVADVSVVPSLYEPFGIVALEAFAAQTPLVVADSGGLSEIVENDKTGVKVIPNDPKSLAQGVTKILLDPMFAHKVQSNAYKELLEKYTWEKVGGKIRRLYQDLAD